MGLTAGVRLGPYEILAPLGAGGMGEVYRARDTRLGREVAVKVLPADVSSTEEWRKRFEREAKAISKLAHPHVCALFDVGSQDDVDYLVMELLSGVTLATRLAKGPMSFEEVLRFGAEMASALAATHAMGIAHGDLKPSNVMLTQSGVKLLDYGVARPLTSQRPEARDGAWASTLSHAPKGEVVGTFPYMAPEQFDGKPADASTDIFALGAVLFEMATGRRAFAGNSPGAVMSAILTSAPPPVSSLRHQGPPGFDGVVGTCLAKDPTSRWSSAHDIVLLLRKLQERPDDPPVATGARRLAWPWAVALLALCAAAAAMLRPAPAASGYGGPLRFGLGPPTDNIFFWGPESDSIAVAPDGSQVAFVAVTSKGKRRLWLRRMNDLEARPLPTTDGVESVFWSPDGRSVGFFAGGMLKRIDLPDGAAVVICPVPSRGTGASGTWGERGEILFSSPEGQILRVPASGGTPSVEVRPDAAQGEILLRYPRFLPDGERFLYLAGPSGRRVLMMATPGRPTEKLMPVSSKVEFSEPGFLVFAREGALLGQKFDWRRGKLSGAPFAIAKHVRGFVTTAAAEFATSSTGTLVVQSADDAQRLAVLDRSGRELGTLASSGKYFDFTISPSGGRLAFSRATPGLGTADLWSFDVERGVETRLTSAIGNEMMAVWMPGEKALTYSAGGEGGPPHLVRRDLETGAEIQLLPVRDWQASQDVSPDGSSLLYTEQGTLWKLPASGVGAPSSVLTLGVSDVCFSPDGRYIAFLSDESGEDEAYVTPYPGPGERTRISSAGAFDVRWNRQTGTLFYSDLERRLWSVPISTQPGLHIGTPTLLFTAQGLAPRPSVTGPAFDVFPDGKRFLVAVPEMTADEVPLTVVVNWPTGAPN